MALFIFHTDKKILSLVIASTNEDKGDRFILLAVA